MEFKDLTLVVISMLILVCCDGVWGQADDFSDPIRCYYCFEPAQNSSCADPVNKKGQGNNLTEIHCADGICLKWTHYYGDILYMHRTCSSKLDAFNIMMIDGVCRSESDGRGFLCMCGRHLCNSAESRKTTCKLVMLSFVMLFSFMLRVIIVY